MDQMQEIQLHIGLYQGIATSNLSTNLAILERTIKEAKLKNIDLVLFPELFLSGYDTNPHLIRNIAHDLMAGRLQLTQCAADIGIAVAVGYPEWEPALDGEGEGDSDGRGGLVYNSCCIIDRTGQVILNARKVIFGWFDLV
jgi:predicted amidohydrolase